MSYRQKHNEPNGQNNHDGAGENFSENYGAEWETTDPQIGSIRTHQIKNFLLTLFISRGVPMLLGDECRRTQGGNNNAYCQDNETRWSDWSFLAQHQEMYRFTRGMIAFRRAHPMLSTERFYTDAEIHWFSPHGDLPHWTDPKAKQLACLIHESEHQALCLRFNAGAEEVDFRFPLRTIRDSRAFGRRHSSRRATRPLRPWRGTTSGRGTHLPLRSPIRCHPSGSMNILLRMEGDVDGGHMARAIPITSGLLDSCILPP